MPTLRRPPGLVAQKPLRARSALGEYLAREARLLRASAEAFRSLSDALFAVGAPCALTGRAACAANDRGRHAELVARLASRSGGRPAPLRIAKQKPRTLAELALDNVVEGCVRDTYGALVAAWQAEHARSRSVAAAMDTIARDALRHAALGWALSGWFLPQLKRREQTAVERALHDAVGKLERAITEPDPALVRSAGLPTRREQRALIAELQRTLWENPPCLKGSSNRKLPDSVARGRVGRPPARWGRLALYIEQSGLSRRSVAEEMGFRGNSSTTSVVRCGDPVRRSASASSGSPTAR